MEKKKKKTRSGARLLPALLALTIGLGALAWIVYSRYTMFEGEILPRDTEFLDLRGKDATDEKIAAAREALPNARVLYDVTIAGKTYSCDEKEIVTGDFAVGDIPLFSRFEGLESVDASECSDLEAIRALREALPGAAFTLNQTDGEAAAAPANAFVRKTDHRANSPAREYPPMMYVFVLSPHSPVTSSSTASGSRERSRPRT